MKIIHVKTVVCIAIIISQLLGINAFARNDRRAKQQSLANPANRFHFNMEWKKAGVNGGLPDGKKVKNIRRISPSDNLQDAIITLANDGGGVILLKAGEYVISSTIKLESGVILRGCNKDSVLLSVKIHGYHFSTQKPRQSALYIGNKEFVGIENLTLQYTGASFEPIDKDSPSSLWDNAVFHVRELRDTTLFVEHIWIDGSKNCWVNNCNLLCAGNNPMLITNSKYITCCNNYIDRCFNKCDGGMGYYDITNSSYVLVHNETIRRIRHFAIQKGSSNNVVINNYLEVDINFHDGDNGYNLVAGNTIRIPEWHSWHCFSRGDLNQHRPPGKNNLLFNNDAIYKNGKAELSEKDQAYIINSTWSGNKAFLIDLKKLDKKKLNQIIHDQYPN